MSIETPAVAEAPPPGSPRIVKRYANRKLYDTTKSRYVTLDQVADLIRDGENVRIVDHRTGEDITSMTMAQIVFEREKRGRSLPTGALRSIIQQGEEALQFLRDKVGEVREGAERQMERIEKALFQGQEDFLRRLRDYIPFGAAGAGGRDDGRASLTGGRGGDVSDAIERLGRIHALRRELAETAAVLVQTSERLLKIESALEELAEATTWQPDGAGGEETPRAPADLPPPSGTGLS